MMVGREDTQVVDMMVDKKEVGIHNYSMTYQI